MSGTGVKSRRWVLLCAVVIQIHHANAKLCTDVVSSAAPTHLYNLSEIEGIIRETEPAARAEIARITSRPWSVESSHVLQEVLLWLADELESGAVARENVVSVVLKRCRDQLMGPDRGNFARLERQRGLEQSSFHLSEENRSLYEILADGEVSPNDVASALGISVASAQSRIASIRESTQRVAQLHERGLWDVYMGLVEALPERERQIIVLWMEGYETTEICSRVEQSSRQVSHIIRITNRNLEVRANARLWTPPAELRNQFPFLANENLWLYQLSEVQRLNRDEIVEQTWLSAHELQPALTAIRDSIQRSREYEELGIWRRYLDSIRALVGANRTLMVRRAEGYPFGEIALELGVDGRGLSRTFDSLSQQVRESLLDENGTGQVAASILNLLSARSRRLYRMVRVQRLSATDAGAQVNLSRNGVTARIRAIEETIERLRWFVDNGLLSDYRSQIESLPLRDRQAIQLWNNGCTFAEIGSRIGTNADDAAAIVRRVEAFLMGRIRQDPAASAEVGREEYARRQNLRPHLSRLRVDNSGWMELWLQGFAPPTIARREGAERNSVVRGLQAPIARLEQFARDSRDGILEIYLRFIEELEPRSRQEMQLWLQGLNFGQIARIVHCDQTALGQRIRGQDEAIRARIRVLRQAS